MQPSFISPSGASLVRWAVHGRKRMSSSPTTTSVGRVGPAERSGLPQVGIRASWRVRLRPCVALHRSSCELGIDPASYVTWPRPLSRVSNLYHYGCTAAVATNPAPRPRPSPRLALISPLADYHEIPADFWTAALLFGLSVDLERAGAPDGHILQHLPRAAILAHIEFFVMDLIL